MRRASATTRPIVELMELRLMLAAYYVGGTGASDSPSGGSDSAPWATLQYAATHVRGGDTCIVRPGT
jgi:hypothetical protein